MIHSHFTTLMRTGIFQYHGQGFGELCRACGIDRHLLAFCAVQPDSTPGNQVVSMPTSAFFDHALEGFKQQQSILLEKLQTQNA